MKILVTGAKGFVGKNLVAELKNRGYTNIYEYNRETKETLLDKYTKKCDFIFHLAGVNRPEDEEDFMKINHGLTAKIIDKLKQHDNPAPILFTSSIQAKRDNPYGNSKEAAEEVIFSYAEIKETKVFVYRLPNLFGKWSKPNYNSVIATFCYNIARDLDIRIDDPETELTLAYIDDVVDEFIDAMEGSPTRDGKYCKIPTVHKAKLGTIADKLKSFKKSRDDLYIPNVGNDFTKKLYSTYISYLPEDNFSYELETYADDRGSFTEMLRSKNCGQVSINISKPEVSKGDHWHHSKIEKFLVVKGKALIKFRDIYSDDVIEYKVSDENLEVIDIPAGHTHKIINIGDEDLITVLWANECYDPENPDTYTLEV